MDQQALAGNAHKSLREFCLNVTARKGSTFSTCLHAIHLLAIYVATARVTAQHVKISQESVHLVRRDIIFNKEHAYPCVAHNMLFLHSNA